MSQHEERARAIRQARKLMEMTTSSGASESEAEFAMRRLGEIQDVYNLTLDEIVLETLDYKLLTLESTLIKGCPMESLVVGIGKFTDTKVWRNPGKRKYMLSPNHKWRNVTVGLSHYNFFGLESDITMAEFIYNYLKNTLNRLEADFKKTAQYVNCTRRGAKRAALDSFRKGFCYRVSTKMISMAASRESNKQMTGTGNDIVLCKESVRERKYQEQIGGKLVKRYSNPTVSNNNAWSAGYNSGDVDLNRPISNNEKVLRIA